MINNVILENCKKKKKNLSTTWIDYKESIQQCTPFLDTCMPQNVQDKSSTNNIHWSKHETMENQYGASPWEWSSWNRANQYQERDISGWLIKSTTLYHVPQSLKLGTLENRIWIPTGLNRLRSITSSMWMIWSCMEQVITNWMDSSAQWRKYQMTSRWNLDWTNVQRPHSREARKYQLKASYWMTISSSKT